KNPMSVAEVYYDLADRLNITQLMDRIIELPRSPRAVRVDTSVVARRLTGRAVPRWRAPGAADPVQGCGRYGDQGGQCCRAQVGAGHGRAGGRGA
ncbi:hypothetical protein, partial [Streptomyces mirabilis]